MFRRRKKDGTDSPGTGPADGSTDDTSAGADQMGDMDQSDMGQGGANENGAAEDSDQLEAQDVSADLDQLNIPGAKTDLKAGGEPSEFDRLKAESRENYDKFLRTAADLENVKKRAMKERSELIKYAGENLAKDVVEVLDDLERALLPENSGSLEAILKGVALIRDRFVSILEQHSIKPQSGLGSAFDPLVQQALASVPTADHSPGMVIQEFKKAYHFRDKLLRPGQVVVSAAPLSDASGGNRAGSGEDTE